MTATRTLTQAELVAEARERFGDDALDWAFRCPSCGDVATARDFRDAGADPNRIGQACIGRSLGALRRPVGVDAREWGGRGCDWVAYGLFRGPWFIVMPRACLLDPGRTVASFPLADAPAASDA